MSTEYNHSRKTGNAGDVWKHFILLNVADCLAGTGSFTYAETHSGIGIYSLGESGEWRNGIGRILKVDHLSNHPYFQIAQQHILQSQTYLGSWNLLSEHLGHIDGLSCSFHLFDTSNAVAAWFRDNSPDKVSFIQDDGFNGIRFIPDRPNLVLIDPPYSPDASIDWQQVEETALYFLRSGIHFLAWYPLFWPTKPQHLVDTTGCCAYEVQWSEIGPRPSQNMKGCGMLTSPECMKFLNDNSEELTTLANALNGKFQLRRPQSS